MNKIISVLTAVSCMGVLAPSAWCQAGKIGTQLMKKAPSSALDVLGSRFSAGANIAKTQAALERAANFARLRSPHLLRSDILQKQGEFNTFVAHRIDPTPAADLRLRLVSPSLEQSKNAVQEYMDCFADFRAMRKEVDPVLGNALLERINLLEALHPSQLGYYAGIVQSMEFRVKKLQRTLFPNDPALAQVKTYLEFAASKFNKFYSPEISTPKGYVGRPFVQEEFWMEYDWRNGERDAALTALPENVRLAVLNDSEDILDMYKLWERQGRFPAGWKVSGYEDALHLLNAVEAGQKFDLIVSDINVPGGGGRYFVHRLREMGIQTPVIGCSGYTRDKIDSKELHDIGFDGYMYSDDMFEETSGFYKWKSYVSNYYYYQRVGGWPR